jgi:hypothetical protein
VRVPLLSLVVGGTAAAEVTAKITAKIVAAVDHGVPRREGFAHC